MKNMRRNSFIERDGLYWESDTHEWFNDNISTNYAKRNTATSGADDALDIACFIVRNKNTGEYDRVAIDGKTNKLIFSTKVLEELGMFLDKLKIKKRFYEK